MINKTMLINEYHAEPAIGSSILKIILKSNADYAFFLKNGFETSKAKTLGDAMHAYILEPQRFKEMYAKDCEIYKRKTGDKLAGDLKTDSNGEPLFFLKHFEDENLNISGVEYSKFLAMVDAYENNAEAQEIIKTAKGIEFSVFDDGLKCRPDALTNDGYLLDIKTTSLGGDKPSDANSFARACWTYGYDLQAYMYLKVCKKDIPNLKGFKFMCIDATIPSGIKIHTIKNDSMFLEIGKARFELAMERLKNFDINKPALKYEEIEGDGDLVSYEMADWWSKNKKR